MLSVWLGTYCRTGLACRGHGPTACGPPSTRPFTKIDECKFTDCLERYVMFAVLDAVMARMAGE